MNKKIEVIDYIVDRIDAVKENILTVITKDGEYKTIASWIDGETEIECYDSLSLDGIDNMVDIIHEKGENTYTKVRIVLALVKLAVKENQNYFEDIKRY